MARLWQVYPCRFRDSMYCLHDNGTVVFRVRKLMPSSAGRLLLEQVWSILPVLELLPLDCGMNMQCRQMDQIWFRLLLFFLSLFLCICCHRGPIVNLSVNLTPGLISFACVWRRAIGHIRSILLLQAWKGKGFRLLTLAKGIQLDLVGYGNCIEAWPLSMVIHFGKWDWEPKKTGHI